MEIPKVLISPSIIGLLERCCPHKSRDHTCMAKSQGKDDKMTLELTMLIWQIVPEINAFFIILNMFLQTRQEIHDVHVPLITIAF
jgi:hypothetical protein